MWAMLAARTKRVNPRERGRIALVLLTGRKDPCRKLHRPSNSVRISLRDWRVRWIVEDPLHDCEGKSNVIDPSPEIR